MIHLCDLQKSQLYVSFVSKATASCLKLLTCVKLKARGPNPAHLCGPLDSIEELQDVLKYSISRSESVFICMVAKNTNVKGC